MSKSAVILTIGSSFWSREPYRQAWRDARLNIDAAIRVRAPIRYGRQSIKSGTYSMVFSNSLLSDQGGWALAVPCSSAINSFADLAHEAEALWAAEQPKASEPGPLAATWGAVGLLANPTRPGLESLVALWTTRILTENAIYRQFPGADGETPAITPSGALAIAWPITETGDSLDVDFVLATANRPTTPYATPQKIADECRANPKAQRYFDETRRVGISTAFDNEILQCLKTTG